MMYEDSPPSVLPSVATPMAGHTMPGCVFSTANNTASLLTGSKVAARKLLPNSAHRLVVSVTSYVATAAASSMASDSAMATLLSGPLKCTRQAGAGLLITSANSQRERTVRL